MDYTIKVLLLLFLTQTAFSQTPAVSVPPQNFNKVRLASVYDGDTFKVYLSCHYPIFCKAIPVRVRGVDCPEMKGGTEETKAAARAARDFTMDFLKNGKILLRNCGRDKYFRLLCDVKVNGQSLAEALISAGHAVAYSGGKHEKK